MDRRSFITKTTLGIGGVTLSYLTPPFIKNASANSKNKSSKKLLATTEYVGNISYNDKFMDRTQLDELHKCLAELGVTRHQWIIYTIWSIHENHPYGIDILEEAVKSAHAYGIEFYALIKPFEECGYRPVLPHSLPFPEGAVAFKDIRGIKPQASRFAAKHVDMCLKRRPGTYEFHGPIAAVNLVKDNDKPTSIKAEHLSIWTSKFNNGFVKYSGPVFFRDSVESRTNFPKWKQCRVLHLENLKIPENHTHILIKCSLPDNDDEFKNEYGKIIELIGPDGNIIPSTMNTGPVSLETDENRFYKSWLARNHMVRYMEMPEVKKEVHNADRMKAHYSDFYNYDRYYITETKSLTKDGYVAAVCGKPEYLPGNLHPIYPEVREHWLELTKYCLDRGVDGINFRVANHTQDPEYWEYGFNEPVLKVSGGKTDYPTIMRINGDAYTQFLREAKELIKSRGKSVTVHIFAQMLAPDDRPGRLSYIPPNFEWQWKTWVNEIADDLEFRGVFTLQPWHVKQVLETIIDATSKANKPLYFQGKFHEMTFDGPNYRTQEELDMISDYSGIDGFCLYETHLITKMNKNGELILSPDIKNRIKNYISKSDE
ncbi:MAG: hypothetical protein JW833_13415 [Prolixibacteraceae bacterium]|nr:hypothetical protein [Prolixibacteraceae bacterium]